MRRTRTRVPLVRRRIAGIRWLCRAEADPDLLARVPALFDGETPAPGSRAITWSRKKKAVIVDDAFIVKKYAHLSWLQRLRFLLIPPPAWREMIFARRVDAMGIPTVVPEAGGTQYRRGLPVASYVVVRKLDGARDLEQVLETHPPRDERRRFIRKLARLTRAIHSGGIYQYDFNPSNFLVAADGSLRFIDMAKVGFYERLVRTQVVENLARLLRAAIRLEVGATDAARFFRAYRDTAGRLSRDDKRLARHAIRRCEQLLARRERKIRSDCLADGRRFYRIDVPAGTAHLAVRHYGERRRTAAEVETLIGALDAGRGAPEAWGGAALAVRRFEREGEAVEAWRRINVEHVLRRTDDAPVALLLRNDGGYLLTRPGAER